MKWVAILWIISSTLVHAGVYSCGEQGLSHPAAQRAHQFLASLPARFTLGECLVELQMCDPLLAQSQGSLVGEMAVTDRYGQFFYLPFDFAQLQTPKARTVIKNGRRMVHYEFIERLPDQASGRTEAYRLEILKTPDLAQVESLDLGVYTSRLRKSYPKLKKNKSYWINCEGDLR